MWHFDHLPLWETAFSYTSKALHSCAALSMAAFAQSLFVDSPLHQISECEHSPDLLSPLVASSLFITSSRPMPLNPMTPEFYPQLNSIPSSLQSLISISNLTWPQQDFRFPILFHSLFPEAMPISEKDATQENAWIPNLEAVLDFLLFSSKANPFSKFFWVFRQQNIAGLPLLHGTMFTAATRRPGDDGGRD